MQKTYKTITGTDGQTYLMKTDELTEMKAELSWKAKMLWNMMEDYQEERFSNMVAEKTLVPFLNKVCEPYHQNMKEHIQNGLNEMEANEIEWPLLVERAGL